MSKRIILPYFLILFFQCLLLLYLSHFQLYKILMGGYGPGSYYIWIYLQIWLLAPIVYLLFKKSPLIGIIVVYSICILLNIICSYYCPNEVWRLLAVRYLSLSVMAWIWLKESSLTIVNKSFILFLSFISLIYLWFFTNYDASPFIYSGSWVSQNYPVFFWTLFVVVVCIKIARFFPSRVQEWLVWLGTNSWEVFLAQMFFISCVSINHFPQFVNPFITNFLYVIYAFVTTIGSVVVYHKKKYI